MTAYDISHAEAGDGLFDPLSEVFVAQFHRPPDLLNVNLRALSPFQRALLVIDGTVTKFIEAWTLEPVAVVQVSQDRLHLGSDEEWLEAAAGTPVIARTVILEGQHTGRLHGLAASLLVVERLPEDIERRLRSNPGGLGRTLLESRLETFREVLWYGRERLGGEVLPVTVGSYADEMFIARTYRIIAGGQPIMLINERFPASPDAQPSHH